MASRRQAGRGGEVRVPFPIPTVWQKRDPQNEFIILTVDEIHKL
jgi:hypothetical protein